jgi:CubicO group peptidase (beta-lactamase class C family)
MNTGFLFDDMLKFHKEMDFINWQLGGEKMRYMFLARPEFLPHAVIHRNGNISPLEYNLRGNVARFVVQSKQGQMPLERYVQEAPVNGAIILHHGRIVFEAYPRMRSFDKHLFMSVSKAYVGTMIAILEDKNLIDTKKPVDTYLEEVTGSGWEGVSVRDVLDMTSGISSIEVDQEAYTDPQHPHYQYEASLGWLEPTPATCYSTYDYIASINSKGLPGQVYEYSSTNTFVLSWIVEKITNKPFHEVLSQEIWAKIGAESDGLISISKAGAPATHGGLCGTLRDMARFGLLFTPSKEVVTDEKLISSGYLDKIQSGGRPEIFEKGVTGKMMIDSLAGEKPSHNSYQWDFVMEDGDFFKGGFGGQGLYISPAKDLVIAYFGTPFDEKMQENDLVWISRQLVKSHLFE